MNTENNFINSLITGFFNASHESQEEYRPDLLINDIRRGKKVISSMVRDLQKCDEFYFSTAFITNSGIAALFTVLRELEEKGVPGYIITSQYLNFTEPRALKRLLQLKNIRLRVVTDKNLHIKGYIFKKRDSYTVNIGSSNLTQNALSVNQEWNLKISSKYDGEIITKILNEFKLLYNEATDVTSEWIDEYEKIYELVRKSKKNYNINNVVIEKIEPNKMQKEALLNLNNLRKSNKNRALLVSATGTGKTYLSAFDAIQYSPKRLLFVVHRENILKSAMKSYQKIFGNKKSMGLFVGSKKRIDADFIFATVQSIAKEENLHLFSPEEFEYIVIDEVHHSVTETYQKIIQYFRPQFLLGMSATPERMDGRNIFEIFDYNIAYEIRLDKALEENMLVPFHYYGISDLTINGEFVSDTTKFNHLVCDERVEKIIESSQLYGCDRGKIKGLIFCSKVEEAKEISANFNKKGYRTVALSGINNEDEREKAIIQLENEELDYIFSVDIFNEGIDIPSVNQIIMLRPTQSATIFIQQLGRGLRKAEDKEYLVVIDFIGNYMNNYLIPIALYGNNSYNKDTIRKLMSSGSDTIPGASTISFDEITKQKIFQSIDCENISKKSLLKRDYQLLKFKLGRIPTMMDFIKHGSRDPYTFIENAGSYNKFVNDVECDFKFKLSEEKLLNLEFFSREICNAKRIEEIVLLKKLMTNDSVYIDQVITEIKNKFGYVPSDITLNSAIKSLNGEFILDAKYVRYKLSEMLEVHDGQVFRLKYLKNLFTDNVFYNALEDLIEFAVYTYKMAFKRERYINGFVLYEKYTRKDVSRILNWDKNEEGTIFGYKIKNNTCPIFVNYEKEEYIDESTKYDDKFVNRYQFSWMTRSRVNLSSKEVKKIQAYKEDGLRILLFVKKSNNEGKDFYYMGDLKPINFEKKSMKDNEGNRISVVNIIYSLKVPVEEKMYDYITK